MRLPRSVRTSATLACLLASVTAATHLRAQGLDRPMPAAWPAAHEWSGDMEQSYGEFITTIGRAVAAGRCGSLAECLNDPAINPLYEQGQRRFRFRADCADVAYILRAYFSYRHQLPFAFSREMRGRGHDARYFADAHPEGIRLWTEFRTPRELLHQIGSLVHSGFFRTAPDDDRSDFYQAAVNRAAIRPGTMFYDPNGHVLLVYDVRPSGDVLFFDGHPDNSVSHPHFSERQVLGGMRQGGGFKNFRPIYWRSGNLVRTPNNEIALYGAGAQFDRTRYRVGGHTVTYQAWVRALLSTPDVNVAPSATPSGASQHSAARTNCAFPHCEPGLLVAALPATHRRRAWARRAVIA